MKEEKKPNNSLRGGWIIKYSLSLNRKLSVSWAPVPGGSGGLPPYLPLRDHWPETVVVGHWFDYGEAGTL